MDRCQGRDNEHNRDISDLLSVIVYCTCCHRKAYKQIFGFYDFCNSTVVRNARTANCIMFRWRHNATTYCVAAELLALWLPNWSPVINGLSFNNCVIRQLIFLNRSSHQLPTVLWLIWLHMLLVMLLTSWLSASESVLAAVVGVNGCRT